MNFINEQKQSFKPHDTQYEFIEIEVVSKLLDKDAVVLELGSRLGIVSNYINKKLNDKRCHVAVEPFKLYAETSEENRKLNDSEYVILNGAISDLPLFYDSEKVHSVGRDNTTPCLEEQSNIKTYSYYDAIKLLPKSYQHFTHLVVDCEGSFERFVKENFHHIPTWRWIFLETDCGDICDYVFIDRVLRYFGFQKQTISQIHVIYKK